MNTFTEPWSNVRVIGTKKASELSSGDKVYFPVTGLCKRVHSAENHRGGITISYDPQTDRAMSYPKHGVLVRWSAPHNKINWYVAPDTVVEIA